MCYWIIDLSNCRFYQIAVKANMLHDSMQVVNMVDKNTTFL